MRKMIIVWVLLVGLVSGCGRTTVAPQATTQPPATTVPTAQQATQPTSDTSTSGSTDSYMIAGIPVAIADVQTITIDDSWIGLSQIAPLKSTYYLTNTANGFIGTAFFSVAGWSTPAFSKTIPLTLENDVIKTALLRLSQAAPQKAEYEPLIEHTDDYPQQSFLIVTNHDQISFYTASQGEDHTPWGVMVNGVQDTIVTTAHPMQAMRDLYTVLPNEEMGILIDQARKQLK